MKSEAIRKYATSIDVAQLAGVSQSAVSRTYTPGASVSPKTRAKVLAAAEQLEYQPSMIPQIMLGKRSKLVAVVLGGLGNPYYAEFLEELTKQMERSGNRILVLYVESDYALDAIVAQLASYRVDAVISALAVLSEGVARELSAFKIPIITFNSHVSSGRVISISANNKAGGAQVARLFLKRGAKRPAFLSGPTDSVSCTYRLDGFRKALRDGGMKSPHVLYADRFSYESGYQAVAEGPGDYDALFCGNDLLALGAMDALRREKGLLVPQDCMVAGYDDIPEASWRAYELTTVPQDMTLFVQAALGALEEALSAPGQEIAPITIRGTLIERASTMRS